MDKKKVKELIKQAIGVNLNNLVFKDNKHNAPINKANALLSEAIRELSKSDWVSVEDGLPECGEKVLVTSKTDTNLVWITTREESGCWLDSNSFVNHKTFYEITHWQPIEKLKLEE